MNNDEYKHYVSKRFWIRCICLVLVFIAGIVFSYIIMKPFWLDNIQNKIIFDTNNLTNVEIKFLENLISENKIYTADIIFERLIHFYENLITVIVSITAFLGIIGYLYIKNSHQRDIYDGIYSILNSDMGLNLLNDLINKNAKKYFDAEFNKSLNYGDLRDLQVTTQTNSEENEGILKRLNIIETQIEKLSKNKKIDTEKIEATILKQDTSSQKTHQNEIAIEVDTESIIPNLQTQEKCNAKEIIKNKNPKNIKRKR